MWTRRQACAGLALIGCGLGMPSGFAVGQIRFGNIEILTVSDGHLVLPGSFFFSGLPQEELGEILSAHNVSPAQIEPPCNVTVLKDAERTILFDAGAGAGFMPSAGDLVASLDSVGIAPTDITHILFTHAHPDHLWGVLDDFDDPTFPEAQYMIGQTEWDYWWDPATVDTIGADRAAFAVGARRRLEAIEDRCTHFADGEEIMPGVKAQASFGHTPGHMAFEIRSGTEAVMVAGDAIGNHHVAFARPDWASGADQDTALGVSTRVALLDQLAGEQMRLIGFHLPAGGVGRVERMGQAYRFVPEGL